MRPSSESRTRSLWSLVAGAEGRTTTSVQNLGKSYGALSFEGRPLPAYMLIVGQDARIGLC